jgi:hypothetical protein
MSRPILPVLCLLALAATPTVRAASSPTARAKAEDSCTWKGKPSAICLRFVDEVLDKGGGRELDSDVISNVRLCYEDARHKDQHPETRNRAYGAERLQALVARKAKGADSEYVTECLRITGEQDPALARSGGEQLLEGTIRRVVEAEFEGKCGTRAAVLRGVYPPQVALYGRGKSKAVVWSGVDPDGAKLSLRCDGYLVGKTRAGKALSYAPTTMAVVEANRRSRCISACQSNAPICRRPPERRDDVPPACRTHCAESCR